MDPGGLDVLLNSTVPLGSDPVVRVSPALIVIGRLAVFIKGVPGVESVTVICTVLDPAVEGVPEIAPLELLIVRPAGNPVAVKV